MAKEEKSEKPKSEGKKDSKKKLHLHQIRTVQAHDGTYHHHHTYKDHKDDDLTHPEREAMATSGSPDEAGQHIAEQFGMNGGGMQPEEAGAEPGQEAGGEPEQGEPEPEPQEG